MQVVLSLTPGGTEHLVVEICRRLGAGVRRRRLLPRRRRRVGGRSAGARHRGHGARRRPGSGRRSGRRSRSSRQSAQIDVLHCHQYSPFVYGRIATFWNRRLKIVYTEHGRLSDAPPSWKRRLVNPLLSRLRWIDRRGLARAARLHDRRALSARARRA